MRCGSTSTLRLAAPVSERGQRLRAAHAAEAGGEDGAAGQVGRAPVTLTGGGEGLEGALQDALGADVDPRAGRHLAEHGQALGLEPAELVPGGEARHQQRVGDQHARGTRVGLEDGDRLAALDEHRLVVLELEQRAHDGAEGVVAAGGAAGAAVDDQAGRDPRPPPGRGCCRASAGRLPGASPCSAARCHAARARSRGRRRAPRLRRSVPSSPQAQAIRTLGVPGTAKS